MVLVSVCTMGTSFVVMWVFWAAKVSDMVTISVFTTGGCGGERGQVGEVRLPPECTQAGGLWHDTHVHRWAQNCFQHNKRNKAEKQ